jgi:O-acetyl-ADP-ribose deacetylase (regulator of RNase III)
VLVSARQRDAMPPTHPPPRSVGVLLRLARGDISRWNANAIAVSGNPSLSANDNTMYWRFNGRKSTNSAVHARAGPELRAAVVALPPWSDDAAATAATATATATSALGAHIHSVSPSSSTTGHRCAVGEAVATPAFGALLETCDHVIHAVAPDGLYGAGGGTAADPEVLRRSFAAVLRQAEQLGARSVAIPAIGCGVQGWRPSVAARVALEAIMEHCEGEESRGGCGGGDDGGGEGGSKSTASTICTNNNDNNDDVRLSPLDGLVRIDLVIQADDVWKQWCAMAGKHLGEANRGLGGGDGECEAGTEGDGDGVGDKRKRRESGESVGLCGDARGDGGGSGSGRCQGGDGMLQWHLGGSG